MKTYTVTVSSKGRTGEAEFTLQDGEGFEQGYARVRQALQDENALLGPPKEKPEEPLIQTPKIEIVR